MILQALALGSAGATGAQGFGAADLWSAWAPPSGRSAHGAVYDPLRNRVLVFGGSDGVVRNDLWEFSLDGTPAWAEIAVPGAPPARSNALTVYDPLRDRLIVFGGLDASGPRGDLWELALSGSQPVWHELVPGGAVPSARFGAAGIIDPVRDQLVLYGGDDLGLAVLADCWTLALSGAPAWSLLATSGTVPPGRRGHTAIFDSARDRMVVCGGDDGTLAFADTWSLELGASVWSVLVPAGVPPSARSGHGAVYDAPGDRMILFGGSNGGFRSDDAWALGFAGTPTWALLAVTGTPPTRRAYHGAVLDANARRMIIVGGSDGALTRDVHALGLSPAPAWSPLFPASAAPSARYRHTMVVDARRMRCVLYGGYDGSSTYPAGIWERPLLGTGTWVPLAVPGQNPRGRYGHSMNLDGSRQHAIVFGGHDGIGRTRDIWSLDLSPGAGWTLLAPAGTPPSARQYHTAVRDALRDRLIVFGGFDGARRNDVWALALDASATWTALAPSGTPPSARTNAAAIYDPVRDRMVLCGGSDGALRNDVWVLSLGASPAWSEILPGGTAPAPRAGHTAVYDPVRDRMVLFGGESGAFTNDTWALSLEANPQWTPLAPAASAPPGRRYHAAAYNPARDGVLVSGGWNGHYLGDTALFEWGEPARPTVTAGPDLSATAGTTVAWSFTGSHSMASPRALEWVVDLSRNWPGFPARGLILVPPGQAPVVPLQIAVPETAHAGPAELRITMSLAGGEGFDAMGTAFLGVTPTTDALVDAGAARALRIEGVGPNPTQGAVQLVFETTGAGRAAIDVFDVAGRRLQHRDCEVTAGEHRIALGEPSRLPAGVYFAEVRFAGETARLRFVVAR